MSIEGQVIWEHDMSVLHQERFPIGKKMIVGIHNPTFNLRAMEVVGEDRIKLVHLDEAGKEITDELQGDDITRAQLLYNPGSSRSDVRGKIIYVSPNGSG